MTNNEKLYLGEFLIQTVFSQYGTEKHIYIKESLGKKDIVHLDTDGARLAIKYNLEKITNFIQGGILTATEGEKLKEDIQSFDFERKTSRKWNNQHPNSKQDETNRGFLEITEFGSVENEKQISSIDINVIIRKLIAKKDIIEEEEATLFRTNRSDNHFAITKPFMDRMFHFPALLENAEAKNINSDQWEITASLDNRQMGPIGLSHSFRAVDAFDAKKYLDEYRDFLRGEGLKVLITFWKMACERKCFHFPTSLSEVMRYASEESRTSPFSVKERRKYWYATRRLENTKLTINLKFTSGKKKQKLVIEHRLIDVGARTHDLDEDRYPNDIMVKVLDPAQFQQQSQIGTAIHNNTLKLHPKDVLLAFSFQIRAAQTMKKDANTFDEEFLLDRANLAKTAKSNKSKARSDLKKKLKKLKKSQIVDDCFVSGKKQKNHTIKKQYS